jgi:hypothetical protein
MLGNNVRVNIVDGKMASQRSNVDNAPSRLELQARSTQHPISLLSFHGQIHRKRLRHISHLLLQHLPNLRSLAIPNAFQIQP